MEVQSIVMHRRLPPPQGLSAVQPHGPEGQDGASGASQCVACLTPGHNQSARKCPYKEERVDACREPACKAGHHRLLHIKGGRKRQGQKGLRAALESGAREGAHPETTDTLRTSHQAEEEGWSCKMRTCRAELHLLRECREFRELPPAARFDLVRQHDLCQVCLGSRSCQVKGENCRWRNRIRMELCRENRCRRKHHQLLHVEKGLEKEVQGEQFPAESSIAASVSGLAQGGEQWSLGQLAAQWIRTPKGGPCLAFWDTGSQVTLITNRAVQAMGLQAIPSPFVRLQCVGNDRGTTAKARYKVPLLDIGGRAVTLLAFGIENIMSPLQEGDLASMKAAFPEVPLGGLVTAAGEVSLLVGQDNLSLFPVEKRRVGDAALYGSRFGTGYTASGRPPRARGDGGDRRAEACTAVREEHEPKEAADCREPPGEPPESPVCGEVQTATTGITVAQAVGGQGEAEACETPLPWEEEYDDATTTEEDSRLDWEVGQFLRDSDWEDDEDYRDPQCSYSGWRHGYGANSGWEAAAWVAACGAMRVIATMSATQAQEEAAQMVRAAGPRDEGERAAWEAAYLDMWADMKARAAQEMPAHVEVAQTLARSATALEEAAQAAEAAETATPSQTGRDVSVVRQEKLIVGGVSASTAATATDEERRAARKVTYLTMVTDTEARRRAQLTDMKQRLPSLVARLRRLWQDVGCARKSAPTKVLLRASATVDEQLEKAKTLLQFTEKNLKPVEWCLMEEEVYLRSAREHLEVIETRMAPAKALPTSPVKTVVGFLRAGEPIEEHHGQGGRREARAGPFCWRGRRPPGRRASGASGPGPDARTPKGHGLEPPETGVVPTGGARGQARTPPASA